MQFKDVVYAIGDFFQWSFQILPVLGNNFNFILLLIGFIMFFYWMGQMFKHYRAGEQ